MQTCRPWHRSNCCKLAGITARMLHKNSIFCRCGALFAGREVLSGEKIYGGMVQRGCASARPVDKLQSDCIIVGKPKRQRSEILGKGYCGRAEVQRLRPVCAGLPQEDNGAVQDQDKFQGLSPGRMRRSDKCIGCAFCATMCPDTVITVESKEGKPQCKDAYEGQRSRGRGRHTGRLPVLLRLPDNASK